MNIEQKIAAAKALATLKDRPNQIKEKVKEIESEIDQKLAKIASGEIRGRALGGASLALKRLATQHNELNAELGRVVMELRQNQTTISTTQERSTHRSYSKVSGPRGPLQERIALLPTDKFFTAAEAAEILGETLRHNIHNDITRARQLGLIEVKFKGSGPGGPYYYARTDAKLPSERMIEEKSAQLEMERKIAKLEPHPLLTKLDAKPYTYNQLKQYLSGAMGTKSPIVLAKKITELQESGHLRRFVEREKALFVKN